MKRDAYSDDGPVHKRNRPDRITDEEAIFLIPSRVAGSIIGKGGSNISRLRNEERGAPLQRLLVAGPAPLDAAPRTRRPAMQYKASITVPDCPGPERTLCIGARDVDTITEIIREVLPNLAEGGSGSGSNEDLDVRLLIHQTRAGCVIGKGGAKIKELREKTGARLKIFSNLAPQSSERVVQLVGSREAVAAGVREVLDLVRQVPIKGAVQNYDPHNYDDFFADEYGGYGCGGGQGSGGPRGAPRGPPRPSPRAPPPLGHSSRPPPPRAPPMSRSGPPPPRAFNEYPPAPRGFAGPPRGGFGGGGGGGGGAQYGGGFGGGRGGGGSGGGGGDGGFSNNGGGQAETSTQVTIPKDLAGAIIGKAGSRIRKIRGDSGASIEIAEPLPGADDRVITITGTPQRIQMAQYLLQQSVHENNPNVGRGNF